LSPGRFEVLEPGIGFFDQQQFVSFLSCHQSLTSRLADADEG